MSLQRLKDLFSDKGFVVNNYFTLEGYYKLVEIINFKNAISLIVIINNQKHKIPAEKGKHEYELLVKNVNIDTLGVLSDDVNLRSSYREIDHITKEFESEDKLSELYDKPISLIGEESKSIEKFSGTVRQMKRFKLCVKNIPFKFALFDDDCICVLNEDSEIETFYAPDYKNKKRKIFITTSLENFFNATDIEQSVTKINQQFYNILQENQRIETTKIQSMIDSKRNIVTQSSRILDMKKKLFDKIQKLQVQHESVIRGGIEFQKKLRNLNSNSDTNSRLMSDKLRTEIEKNEQQQRDIIKNILDTRRDLDELCLVVDNILFDNMTMLSRINHNFKTLEMLKISQ